MQPTSPQKNSPLNLKCGLEPAAPLCQNPEILWRTAPLEANGPGRREIHRGKCLKKLPLESQMRIGVEGGGGKQHDIWDLARPGGAQRKLTRAGWAGLGQPPQKPYLRRHFSDLRK